MKLLLYIFPPSTFMGSWHYIPSTFQCSSSQVVSCHYQTLSLTNCVPPIHQQHTSCITIMNCILVQCITTSNRAAILMCLSGMRKHTFTIMAQWHAITGYWLLHAYITSTYQITEIRLSYIHVQYMSPLTSTISCLISNSASVLPMAWYTAQLLTIASIAYWESVCRHWE